MLYFIPAWYKQNMWCENEQQWYMRRLKSEFDETIKQITLGHLQGISRQYRLQ
jgi:accessory secretory protein Asp1